LVGLVGVAAGASVGALVLAQVVSQPVAGSALFVVFLAGLFALLACAVIASDQWVQGVWASPDRWPRWVERRRLIRFLLHGARTALNAVARTLRAGIVRLRQELTSDAVKRHARAALDALGLPLEEAEMTPDPAVALEHVVSTRRSVAHHPRVDVDDDRRSFLPAQYRDTRDALEKACQGAKERSAELETHAPPAKDPDAATSPIRISSTVRMVSHHPKPDRAELQRAFTSKRARLAREALKNAGHTALVAAMGIIPDRDHSAPTH
jgi:hypothetical protein